VALRPFEHLPGADGEGAGGLAERRRRLDEQQAPEPHVDHGARRRADVALLARPHQHHRRRAPLGSHAAHSIS
jgi:hypothetical protein